MPNIGSSIIYTTANKGFTETLLKMKAGEKTWSENIEPIGSDVIWIR